MHDAIDAGVVAGKAWARRRRIVALRARTVEQEPMGVEAARPDTLWLFHR